ncbi:MAG: hypothetical protein NDJ90_12020 [Oligoflexia bacterium]|nr:hypothetical protein [Oligoflexia bacterium]
MGLNRTFNGVLLPSLLAFALAAGMSSYASGEEKKDERTAQRCTNSVLINGKYECQNTYDTIETGQMTNLLGQTAGALAVGAAGTVGTMKATQEGTQSAAYSAAASNLKLGATKELGLGAANMYFGYQNYQNSKLHQGQEGAVRTEGNALIQQQEAAAAAGMPAPANPITRTTVGQAEGEQYTANKAAKNAAFAAFVQGAQQLVSGVAAMGAAAQMEAAAKKVKASEGVAFNFKPMTPSTVTPGDVLAPRTPTAISGNGTAENSAATDDQEKTDDLAGLGDPVNLNPNPEGLAAAAPPSKPFISKDAPEAKGGSAPGMSIGGTSAASGGGDGPTSPTAADSRGGAGYEGGGGGGYQGGGGGRAGGKDPDLSNMLAQFLPKKEDEAGQNSILDFGGRNPASEEYSLLDRQANIFERIHQAYQTKQKSKNVGI